MAVNEKGSLTVVTGDNELFKEEYISKACASIKGADETSIYRISITGKEESSQSADIIEKATAMSFFSPVSVLVIRSFEKLPAAEERKVLEFFKNIPGHAHIFAVLPYDERELKKKYDKTPLLDGVIKSFSSGSASDIRKWAASYLKTLGKEIDPQLLDYVLDESDADTLKMRGELEKMALVSAERGVITNEDFEAVRGVKKGHDVWELTAAIANLDEVASFRLLDEIYDNEDAYSILGAVFSTVYEVFIVRHFLSKNNEEGALKYLRNNRGKLYALKNRVKNFSRSRLIDLLALLAETDMIIKRSGPARAKTAVTMMIQKLIMKLQEDLSVVKTK